MRTFKVLVSDKLAPEGVDVFSNANGIEVDVKPGLPRETLLSIIGQYDALAIRSGTKVDAELIAKADNLKVVGRAGIGVDNVDIPAASERGILVMNTPEGNVVTTAEHAISLMCSLARRIPQATASMKSAKWEKSKFQGREMMGKTLGVIGLGNIGKIVAERGVGLKMRVTAYDPFVTKERAEALGVELVDLGTLIAKSDFITLHVPLLDGTKNIISKDAISRMKKGAFLINAARGGLVDEHAAAEALVSGQLGGAAFDVFVKEPPPADHPLLGLDNVILTPHLGASTSEAQVNVAVSVAEQIVDYLKEGVIRNGINAPALSGKLLESVGPYVGLAEKMGRLAGQLHEGGVREIRVRLAGVSGDVPAAPLESAALMGLLGAVLDNEVNAVSAPYIARERGIEVVVERTSRATDFANGVGLSVYGDAQPTTIMGTLFGKDDARIVGLGDFRLEIVPKGRLLLTGHNDQPGIIGQIGSVLGTQGVNISRLSLSEAAGSSELARAAVSIDSRLDDNVIESLEAIDGIAWIKQLDLGS